MTISLSHPGTSPVRLSIPFLGPGSATVWTDQPAIKTEFRSTTVLRTKVDLTTFSQIKLIGRVTVQGFAGSVLGIDYSTDEAAWTTLATEIAIDSVGTKDSGWINLPAAARVNDIFLRIYGTGGDGAVDPAFGVITARVR